MQKLILQFYIYLFIFCIIPVSYSQSIKKIAKQKKSSLELKNINKICQDYYHETQIFYKNLEEQHRINLRESLKEMITKIPIQKILSTSPQAEEEQKLINNIKKLYSYFLIYIYIITKNEKYYRTLKNLLLRKNDITGIDTLLEYISLENEDMWHSFGTILFETGIAKSTPSFIPASAEQYIFEGRYIIFKLRDLTVEKMKFYNNLAVEINKKISGFRR